jgi:N utilization substance protein B
MTAPAPRPQGAPGRKRALARLAAVQALFQVEQGEHTVDDVIDQFLTVRAKDSGEAGMPGEADRAFFAELVEGAAANRNDIEPLIAESLGSGWTMPRVDRLVRCVLLAGVYELRHRVDVPARVVINEYVEIAHAFYGEREPGFVNSVLDRLARRLRPQELPGAGERRDG